MELFSDPANGGGAFERYKTDAYYNVASVQSPSLSISAMKFTFAALAALATLALPTLAQLTATQIVAGINLVSNISQNSNNVLSPLSTSTDGATVQTMSQTLVNNFNTIINDVSALTTGLEATPPIEVTEANHSRRQTAGSTIVAALDNFVAVHQAFLATVIGKHSIFAQFQVTAPIAAVLRSLEAQIDSFAFALINVIPQNARRAIEPQLGSITSDQSALDTAVGNTVTTYSQTCIPSPLYPIILPVCTSA
ncbi:hypothetical protein MVEN_00871900 [Mycena venus]|uniref:Uncharacterized protein n=1 Tax=Mycena venus TaxID=2733690 RepID=A0A8H6YGE3_9AGAR|nr:hypothetical protein MVEN_00871900 [Mycena venus]